MGTKNNPAPNDCYAKAEPDEPHFTLLARDPDAPLLVTLWAILRQRRGNPADDEKIAEAVRCAGGMDDWRLAALDAGTRPAKAGTPVHLAGQILTVATEGLSEHPEGYDWPCACNLCLSYAH
jgi:hypothetical protein